MLQCITLHLLFHTALLVETSLCGLKKEAHLLWVLFFTLLLWCGMFHRVKSSISFCIKLLNTVANIFLWKCHSDDCHTYSYFSFPNVDSVTSLHPMLLLLPQIPQPWRSLQAQSSLLHGSSCAEGKMQPSLNANDDFMLQKKIPQIYQYHIRQSEPDTTQLNAMPKWMSL